MNDNIRRSPDLFTPSGCLTGDALMSFVSGSLKGSTLKNAEQHIADCPLCADAADGLRMWLKENTSDKRSKENLASEASSLSGEQPSEQSKERNPIKLKTELFHARTNVINNRIRQRLHTYALLESAEEKRLSYKPFVWLAAAATIVLFIGGSYILWMQNQSDSKKLAQKLEMDSTLGQMAIGARGYDTLPYPPSESKSVLTIKYNHKKGVESPPVLAIVTEEASRVVSKDEASNSLVDEREYLKSKRMQATDSKDEEYNQSEYYRSHSASNTRNGGAAMKKEDAEEDSGPVYTFVKEMPSFPGGDSERLKFLSKNIRYPQQAAENGIQGTVYVSFVVKSNGSLADIKIIQGIGGGCDEEALRVVKKMPVWKPGYQNGKKVEVLYTMAIKFRLQQ
jgi:TonB family protein